MGVPLGLRQMTTLHRMFNHAGPAGAVSLSHRTLDRYAARNRAALTKGSPRACASSLTAIHAVERS